MSACVATISGLALLLLVFGAPWWLTAIAILAATLMDFYLEDWS